VARFAASTLNSGLQCNGFPKGGSGWADTMHLIREEWKLIPSGCAILSRWASANLTGLLAKSAAGPEVDWAAFFSRLSCFSGPRSILRLTRKLQKWSQLAD
jgi:hypothetical protein